MTDHIKDDLHNLMISENWEFDGVETYRKFVDGIEEAGTISDGSRVVILTIDGTGRWFSRVDGWGTVINDIDLRNFWGDPAGALKKVLDT